MSRCSLLILRVFIPPNWFDSIFMRCVDCRSPLELEDGHDRCPSCLGMEHLMQGLTEQACMNCSCLSVAARAARIAQLEDMLSIRASESLATVDEWAEDQGDAESHVSYTQDASGHGSLGGSEQPKQHQRRWVCRAPSTVSFSVSPSAPFNEELQ